MAETIPVSEKERTGTKSWDIRAAHVVRALFAAALEENRLACIGAGIEEHRVHEYVGDTSYHPYFDIGFPSAPLPGNNILTLSRRLKVLQSMYSPWGENIRTRFGLNADSSGADAAKSMYERTPRLPDDLEPNALVRKVVAETRPDYRDFSAMKDVGSILIHSLIPGVATEPRLLGWVSDVDGLTIERRNQYDSLDPRALAENRRILVAGLGEFVVDELSM